MTLSESHSTSEPPKAKLLSVFMVATLFAAYAAFTVFPYARDVHNALGLREEFDQSFSEIMSGNMEEQRAAVDSLRNNLAQLANAPSLENQRDKIAALQNDAERISRLNTDSVRSIRNWIDASASLRVKQMFSSNLPLLNSARATEWKKGARNGKTNTKLGAPAPSQNPAPKIEPPEASQGQSKWDRVKPFLWAFLFIPFLFGVLAFRRLDSTDQRVQDFSMSTIVAVTGYFFGLGAGAFAVALS